jgi:drug/metabolite transporter (DMT)-like permease
VSLSAGAVLLVVALAFGAPLVTADASWPALLALAIVPTVVGQTALNAALRELPASMVAGAILGEPVIATIVAFFVLAETPGASTIAGSAVVLVGLYLLTVRARASA